MEIALGHSEVKPRASDHGRTMVVVAPLISPPHGLVPDALALEHGGWRHCAALVARNRGGMAVSESGVKHAQLAVLAGDFHRLLTQRRPAPQRDACKADLVRV